MLKNKTNQLILIMIISFSFLITDCKKDQIVDPPKAPSHPTITWTADTIRNPYEGQLFLESIWGSSPSNVYACGHNSSGSAVLWQFNGESWKEIKLNTLQGGTIPGHISLTKVFGLNANDIWLAGSRTNDQLSPPLENLLVHFNGVQWNEVKINSQKGGATSDIFGLSSHQVYSISSNGELYSFDGNNITVTLIDTTVTLISIGGDTQKMLIGGYHYSTTNPYYVLFKKNTDGEWVEFVKISEMENELNSQFGFNLYPIGENKYLSAGSGLFLLNDNAWTKMYSDGNYYSAITGTSSINVYALAANESILHWNGVNWRKLNLPNNLDPNLNFDGLWVSESTVFISAYGTPESQSIILRSVILK